MGYIEWITAITALALSISSLIALGTKSGRNFVSSLFKKHSQDLYETNEEQNKDIKEIKSQLITLSKETQAIQRFSRQQCRNEIKNTYYKYCEEKKIPLFERKSLDLVFQLYHDDFCGNSYATLLYEEICKWEIDGRYQEDFELDQE